MSTGYAIEKISYNKGTIIKFWEGYLREVNHFYKLELIYLFFHSLCITLLFLSCRPFVVITLSTGLVGVDNVVITAKGPQDRNNSCVMERRWKNKGKLILTEIFQSVQNMTFKSIDTYIKFNLFTQINEFFDGETKDG